MIANKYTDLLRRVRPYLLGNPDTFDQFPRRIFNIEMDQTLFLNCLDEKSDQFFSFIHTLDALSFKEQGMGMDKWVFFDCSAMPAGIFGFAIKATELCLKLKNAFNIESSYQGYVPISMYMAIPTNFNNRWFGHNLSSLANHFNGEMQGLGLLTKAIATQFFEIKECYGATQWGSHALEVHTQLSDMKILASRLNSHTHPNSLCYLADYSSENILKALSGEKRVNSEFDFLLEAKDEKAQLELNQRILKGESFSICSRPIHKDQKTFYAIRKNN